MSLHFRIVIPARYGSTRLPGKPLVVIRGKPLVRHVYDYAVESGATEVVIATDNEDIANVARAFGADVQMTSSSHLCGTDRVAEAAAARKWKHDHIVVNLQCDELWTPPANIVQLAGLAERSHMATLCAPLSEADSTSVRVAVEDGRAIYFSRAPLAGACRHIGMYGYPVATLRRFAAYPASKLEQAERLEQLRALSVGISIACEEAMQPPGFAIDTPEDLRRAEEA